MYMYESPLPRVVVVTVALCCRASLVILPVDARDS